MPKTIFIDIIVLQNHERKDIMEEKLGLEMGVCTSCGDNGPMGITLYDVKLRKPAFQDTFPEVVDCVQINGEKSTITILCGADDESGTYSNERTFKLALTVGEEVK